MQDLKIYIIIQDPKTKQDVNITGSFEVLRAFLSGVGTLEIQDPTLLSPSPKRKHYSLAEKPKTAKVTR